MKRNILTMTGNSTVPFLGFGVGKTTGSPVLRLRARTAAGGDGQIQWLPSGVASKADDAKSVPFTIAAGDWQEVSVDVPAEGPLGSVRVYLPAQRQPGMAIDDSVAIVSESEMAKDRSIYERLKQRPRTPGFDLRHAGGGEEPCKMSHAWAVSGRKSTTGKPILESDPQLTLSSPPFFYEFHLAAGRIEVKGGQPVLQEVLTSRHGTVFNSLVRAPRAGEAYLCYDAQTMGDGASARMMLEVLDAANWTEFRRALEHYYYPGLHIVYADTEGNVGYRTLVHRPLTARSPRRAFEGWTGRDEVRGRIPFDELPHLLNPESGYVSHANNLPVGSWYPYDLGLATGGTGAFHPLADARGGHRTQKSMSDNLDPGFEFTRQRLGLRCSCIAFARRRYAVCRVSQPSDPKASGRRRSPRRWRSTGGLYCALLMFPAFLCLASAMDEMVVDQYGGIKALRGKDQL